MFENEVDAYCFFVIVLKLINGSVMAIIVSVRRYAMAYSEVVPTEALLNKLPLILWKCGRATAKILGDVSNILYNSIFLVD